MKFKKGDKVRCIHATGAQRVLTHGQIYTIAGASRHILDCGGERVELLELSGDGKFFANRFDQLKSISDVQHLVEVANAGSRAYVALVQNFGKEVEINSTTTDGNWEAPVERNLNFSNWQFRVKQKPKFSLDKIGQWEVKLLVDKFSIGCKEFDAEELRKGLRKLTMHAAYIFNSPMFELGSCRAGIMCGGYILTWDDADKLLAALEEALK